MALIENSKGRESGGGYERLFGNQLLGHLLSRVQASVITSGNELEHVIIAHSKSIADVDSFLAQQELPPGTYLITKQAIKKSALKSDQEPDLLVFEIEPPHRHCYIIELKEKVTHRSVGNEIEEPAVRFPRRRIGPGLLIVDLHEAEMLARIVIERPGENEKTI